jgi:hypothetical protein
VSSIPQDRYQSEWFETPEFLKLQSQWDQKLKKTGFHDLESRESPDGMLGGWFGGAPMHVVGGAGEYYRGGSVAFYTERFAEAFPNGKDRRIIALHLGINDGRALSVRAIWRRLRPLDWHRIVRVVKRFRAWLRANPSGVAQ